MFKFRAYLNLNVLIAVMLKKNTQKLTNTQKNGP